MANKNIRGWIVRILQRAYPLGMEDKSLHRQLNGLGYSVTYRELQAHLAYLQEDGFLTKQQFGDEYRNELTNDIYKLTTKGVDLAEGSITDEGVEI